MSKSLQESFSFMQAPQGPAVKPPFDPMEVARLAARGLYLGTSSWKYRGWEGMIYRGGYESEASFQRSSLREYTAALPCVGVDFTYYSWPMADMMAYLLESTPENFKLCPKVTKRVTMSAFPQLPAYGKWAGQKNPDFLSPDAFQTKFLEPIRALKDRVGVIQFEFSGPDENELGQMEDFFRKIPRDLPMAVEIRNPSLVTKELYHLLIDLKLAPAFSSWTKMPSVSTQWGAYLEAGGAEDKGTVVGLGILRPGLAYEEAVQLFQPYQEVREPYEEGVQQLTELGLWAMKNGRKAYILLNNRLEGSAPHTIGRIVERIGNRLKAEKGALL
jgi:uncharacterized protein YecE (DUF72 family)